MLPSSTTTTTTASTITTTFLCCFSPPHFCCPPTPPLPMILVRELLSFLKKRRRRQQRQQGRWKSNWFSSAETQLCKCITRFCTFLCRRCTSTKWKCLIPLLMEDANTRQRLSFFFPDLWYSPSEFNSRKISQHLINWTRWSKRDKVWSSATSLFTCRFRSRRRRIIETLRSDNGDGRENVAEKVISRFFNLHCDYSKSITLSNVGESS